MSRTLLWRLCAAALLVLLALAGLLLGLWLRGRRQPRPVPQTVVAFLDVGDGDCTLVRDPDGTTVLLDTGGAASAVNVVRVLRRFHVRTIDLLILAGPDEGSIGGVPVVVSSFPVRQVWDNSLEDTGRARRAALEAVRRRHIGSKIVHAGDNLQIGAGTFWKALWPPEHGPEARAENLVLRLDYGVTRFLFAGTASGQTEGDLIADAGETLGCAGQCSDLVLQTPRGGSPTGTSSELLRCAAPSVAVISCSKDSPPASTTLHRLQAAGVEIRRTDTMGTVIVLTDGRTTPTITAEHL